jgi:hypothetical protein
LQLFFFLPTLTTLTLDIRHNTVDTNVSGF